MDCKEEGDALMVAPVVIGQWMEWASRGEAQLGSEGMLGVSRGV